VGWIKCARRVADTEPAELAITRKALLRLTGPGRRCRRRSRTPDASHGRAGLGPADDRRAEAPTCASRTDRMPRSGCTNALVNVDSQRRTESRVVSIRGHVTELCSTNGHVDHRSDMSASATAQRATMTFPSPGGNSYRAACRRFVSSRGYRKELRHAVAAVDRVRHTAPTSASACRRRAGDRHRAEDLVQEMLARPTTGTGTH
jgi:hypothetical protein